MYKWKVHLDRFLGVVHRGRTQQGKGRIQPMPTNADHGEGVTRYADVRNDTACCGSSNNDVLMEDFCQRPFHPTTIIRALNITYISVLKLAHLQQKVGP